MKKKNSKIIILCIIIMILGGAVLPLLTDWLIFGNRFPSAISNSDWSGFLGSLWGGVIGGIGTLISIYVTTNDVKYSQEIEKNRDKLERIINAASSYWKEAKIAERLLAQITEIRSDFNNIESEISGINMSLINNPGLDVEKKKRLESDLGALEKRKEELVDQINKINNNIFAIVDNIFCEKMILYIMVPLSRPLLKN